MIRWPTALTIAFLLAAACAVERESPPRHDADTVLRGELEATTAAFNEALRTDSTDAMMRFVADDVLMAPPGEAVVRGKEAMRAWHTTFLTQYRTTSLTLADQELFVGEGWAVEFGSFEWALAPAAGGDPMVDRGSYMQVWKRTPEGKWQFAREIWNSGPAAGQ
ncbi:MAG TPA: DUF4440 domain-containing protein [Gemmatimonadales bacterium]